MKRFPSKSPSRPEGERAYIHLGLPLYIRCNDADGSSLMASEEPTRLSNDAYFYGVDSIGRAVLALGLRFCLRRDLGFMR